MSQMGQSETVHDVSGGGGFLRKQPLRPLRDRRSLRHSWTCQYMLPMLLERWPIPHV